MKLFFCFFTSLLLLSQAALAQSFDFSGVDEKTAEQVLKDSSSVSQTLFSRGDRIIRRLMRTGQYEKVQLFFNKEKKIIQIKANPKVSISQFKIIGNNSYSISTPMPKELSVGQVFDQEKVLSYATRIREEYTKAGYLSCQIDAEFAKKKNQAEVILRIKEGPVVEIKEIQVNTENESLKLLLDKSMRRNLGISLTHKTLTNIRKQLNDRLNELGYMRTEISKVQSSIDKKKTQARVSIDISHPFRYDFFIKGQNPENFTEATLIRQIRLSSINEDTRTPEDFAQELVMDTYLKRGFANVKVEKIVKTKEKAFRKEVNLLIEEGQLIRLKKIELLGKYSKQKAYYDTFIKQHSSDIVSKGYLNKLDLEKGISNLTKELRNLGFLNAKVQLQSLKRIKSNQTIAEIKVDEGPITKIKSIQFIGNRSFTDLELIKQLSIKALAALKLDQLEQSIVAINKFYKKNGFLEMKILSKENEIVSYSDDNREVDIKFRIFEGPKIKVSSLLIQGNQKTKNRVIRRELTFSPGETLTPDKIRSSKTNLERLGLFSIVEIYTLEKNTLVSQRTVVVRVRELNPGVIRFGAGVTSERDLTVRGYIAGAYSNIAGTARAINARAELNLNVADINFPENRLTIGYLEPRLFDSTWNARVNLRRSQDIFELSTDEVNILESTDSDLLVDKKITDNIKFTYGIIKLSFLREFEKDGKKEDSKTTISSTGPSFDFDYRNDPFNPKRGFHARLSTEYADPSIGSSSTIQFVKTTAKFSHYLPITKSVTWVNSFGGGYLNNLNSRADSGVPFTEAFFLGGQSTIRGFEALTERFPSNSLLNVDDIDDFSVTRESHFGLFKTEFRFPLPISSLQGAVFYDGGLVRVNGFNFEDEYRDSVGFGLHIITPVGPVNFELGFKLDRKEELNEKAVEFHFSIGSF